MRLRIVVSAVALALASLAWAAGAVADNAHGTPPGQAKASASTSTNASAGASAGAKAQAKGRVKTQGQTAVTAGTSGHARGHAHASVMASAKTGATAQTQAGVAPSSATSHNTFAPALSTKTKLYGNGTTAGQIAVKSGFGSSTLFGPGNSQPHKTNCGPHAVDVHALKAHASACGGAATASLKLHGKAHIGLSAKLSAKFASAVGVKPFAITAHNTFAAAFSSQTKLYGNGQTAGQIATAAGFPKAMLFGPGNSQPHKTTCGTHSIDVHALKAHGGANACNSTSTSESTQATVATSVAQQQAAAAATAKASTSTSSSGVLGAKASAHAKKKSSGGGVLGATAQLASTTKHAAHGVLATAHGSLPFTGLALWLPVALGLGLIASGFGLVRRGRTLS